MALPTHIEAAKDAFAVKHGLPPGEASTLEAFFTHLVLLNRNLSEQAAEEVWKHRTSGLVGGAQDNQIDSVAILLNNDKVLRPGESLDELDMAIANNEPVQLSFIFVQATGSANAAKGVSQKISAFSDGVLAFLGQRGKGKPGVNAELDAWIEYKNRIFDILEDSGMEKCCDIAMYFVSPRRYISDSSMERTLDTAHTKLFINSRLNALINSTRVYSIGLQRLERMIADAGKRRGEFMISLAQFVRAPAPAGVDACYCGFLTVREILELISDAGSAEDGPPEKSAHPADRISQAIFASNIRRFVGSSSPVNSSISQTLRDDVQRRQLGLRSNGLAITARSCQPRGQGHLLLVGAQIVNGCQTSHVLFEHRELLAGDIGKQMWLPVKIIVTDDAGVEGAAILSLNRQAPVDDAQVFTDKAFADGLAHELAHGPQARRNPIYFERREGEFRGRNDLAQIRIVSLYEIAQAYVAAFEGRPEEVAGGGRVPIIDRIRDGHVFGKLESMTAYVIAAVLLCHGREAAGASSAAGWHMYPMKHMLTYATRLIAEVKANVSPPASSAAQEARERYLTRLGDVVFDPAAAGRIAIEAMKAVDDSRSALGLRMDHRSARSTELRLEIERRIKGSRGR